MHIESDKNNLIDIFFKHYFPSIKSYIKILEKHAAYLIIVLMEIIKISFMINNQIIYSR